MSTYYTKNVQDTKQHIQEYPYVVFLIVLESLYCESKLCVTYLYQLIKRTWYPLVMLC